MSISLRIRRALRFRARSPLAALAIAVLASACYGEPPEPTLYLGVVNNGMEEQGRLLLGEELDGWAGTATNKHFSVSNRAVDEKGKVVTLSIDRGAALVTTPRVPIQNLVVVGGAPEAPVTLRLTEVPRLPADATLTQLTVERKYGDGSWGPVPCGNDLAVALAGEFTRTGLHVDTYGRITLACLDQGVAAKCTEWSYRAGTNPASLLWQTHQACTRMARADICAVGRSHTRNATRIWFYDTIPGNDIPDAVDAQLAEPLLTWPPPPDVYYFEAMWRGGDDHAGCLSKLRWQALMPGALCNGLLPDPRSPMNGNGIADYCERSSVEDAIEIGGAILFNKTQYSDLALALWSAERSDGTRDFTTTVRGFVGGPGDPTVHPFWEHAGSTYQPIRPEAFLLRVPPTNLTPQQYAAVATFRNATNDRVLVRKDDPMFGPGSAYLHEFDEGFVTTEPVDGSRTALWLWRHPVTKDLVSSTGMAGPTPQHVRQRLIGYVADPDPFLQ